MPPAPLTVVVPTVGRSTLAACLTSLGACEPAAAEVIVVVQGRAGGVDALIERHAPPGCVVLRDDGRGPARARNRGLMRATQRWVLMTDDDCTVAPDWVGVGERLMRRDSAAVVSGRVIPVGDPARVPSCKDEATPQDFTGGLDFGSLYGNNMLLPRDAALELGGFDERFAAVGAASDGDFAYRWLRAGRALRYVPELVVRHHDWRSDAQLERLGRRYARGLGALYGKALRHGDPEVLRFLGRDLRLGLYSAVSPSRRRARPRDWQHALLRQLPIGVLYGLRRLPPTGVRPSRSPSPERPLDATDGADGPREAARQPDE